jgi:hypothetical protein
VFPKKSRHRLYVLDLDQNMTVRDLKIALGAKASLCPSTLVSVIPLPHEPSKRLLFPVQRKLSSTRTTTYTPMYPHPLTDTYIAHHNPHSSSVSLQSRRPPFLGCQAVVELGKSRVQFYHRDHKPIASFRTLTQLACYEVFDPGWYEVGTSLRVCSR